MAATPGSAVTEPSAVAAPVRRAPMALVAWAFILLVLLIVAVLLVVKVTRGATTVTPPPVAPALRPGRPGRRHRARVAAFDLVGAPAPDGPLARGADRTAARWSPTAGRPSSTSAREFCPYCAAARWALVVALSRFGTFQHLGATSSSPYEAFPQIATFTFDGASYRSRYVSLSAVEEYGQTLAVRVPAGFRTLHHPSALARSLLRRYGTAGQAGGGGTAAGGDTTGGDSGSGATLPFIDIGNRVLVEGAGIGFSPEVLENVSMGQIATELSDPGSAVAQAVLGAADEITAGICAGTGGAPASVCRSPGVRAGALRLGLEAGRSLNRPAAQPTRRSRTCLRSTSFRPPQIPCGSRIRMAYSRQSLRTSQSTQMALARVSRACFSSLRSACVGGKKTAACGPRQAAFACHISSKALSRHSPSRRVTLLLPGFPGQGV